MYRGVIVGLGNVALNGHLPAWLKSEDIQIVAGVDSDPARQELFLKSCPGAKAFSSLYDCNVPFDFVDISTPPHTHAAIAIAAFESGVHVMCEKPLVLSQAEMKDSSAAAQKAGRLLYTVHNWQYAPLCRKVTELLEQNAIGEPVHCAWYVLRSGPSVTTDPNNWRLDPQKSGGGILIDHGWHAFYLVLGWMKAKPFHVEGTLENRQYADLPVEDTAKIKIDFEKTGGLARSAEVFLTWASRIRRNWGVIEGTQGTLSLEDDSLRLSTRDGKSETFTFPAGLSQGSHHPDWFGFVIDDFVRELKYEKHRGENFKMAKDCLRMIECSKVASGRQAAVEF